MQLFPRAALGRARLGLPILDTSKALRRRTGLWSEDNFITDVLIREDLLEVVGAIDREATSMLAAAPNAVRLLPELWRRLSMSGETEQAELESAKRRLLSLNYFGPLAVVVWVTACLVYVARTEGPPPVTAEGWQAVWGQFGDFMGGVVNPVVSLLALLALLATFRVQVGELEIASREMKNSADALKAQNDTLAEQTRHAQQQGRLEGMERAATMISRRIDELLVSTPRAIESGKTLAGHLEVLELNKILAPMDASSEEDELVEVDEWLHRLRDLTHELVVAFDDLVWTLHAYRAADGGPFLLSFYWRRYERHVKRLAFLEVVSDSTPVFRFFIEELTGNPGGRKPHEDLFDNLPAMEP